MINDKKILKFNDSSKLIMIESEMMPCRMADYSMEDIFDVTLYSSLRRKIEAWDGIFEGEIKEVYMKLKEAHEDGCHFIDGEYISMRENNELRSKIFWKHQEKKYDMNR